MKIWHRFPIAFVAAAFLSMGWSPLFAAGLGALLFDTWRGTAPFCDGSCNKGERPIGVSSCGDGGCCWTGHKVLCADRSSTCQALDTRTSCYGVVMVCDNGSYVPPSKSWVSCDKYACGVCFGLSTESAVETISGFSPDVCKSGLAWREAVAKAHVCVPPATRSEAARDNALAAGRREPNGGASGADTCKQGFVWREVTPTDHVCVTPQVRATTAADNRAKNERIPPPITRCGPDTRKQGFVWREAGRSRRKLGGGAS